MFLIQLETDMRVCGDLNKIGPHRPIGSNTIRRCDFVTGSVSLAVGREVTDAQATPSVALSSCRLPIQM